MLLAALGERLNATELAIYREVTKRQESPSDPVAEFWFLVSRRAGKTLSIACLAAYLSACVDHRKVLAPGERGTVLILAASMAQGHPALNILKDIFTNIPAFAALVDRITADTISLKNRIDISIRPASWRTVRGLTAIAVIAEECGVWLPEDGGSKNPDKQILNAARPALATTRGSLYVLATPLYKRGEVWKAFSKHFGPQGNPNILVANAPTRTFNPILDQSIIDQAYEEDPVSAACEWGGMFRDDAAAFVSMDAVLAVVDKGVISNPYEHGTRYSAYVDPATGAGEDSFTCAIGHAGQGYERGLAIVDAIYERRPPFSPAGTISELSNLLHEYHVTSVTGDRFAKGFVSELFRDNHITCRERRVDERQLPAISDGDQFTTLPASRQQAPDIAACHAGAASIEDRRQGSCCASGRCAQ